MLVDTKYWGTSMNRSFFTQGLYIKLLLMSNLKIPISKGNRTLKKMSWDFWKINRSCELKNQGNKLFASKQNKKSRRKKLSRPKVFH